MKTFKLNILFTILFMSLLLPCFAGVDKNSQEKRVALVIGNAKYKSSPLDNPVKDAKAFQEKLKGLNFEVSTLYDADLDEMDAALKNFYKKADESDLALLYYSGHGIEYEGINYLLPVGEEIDDEESLYRKAVDLNRVMDKICSTECSKYIVILDACRDNPIKKTRGAGRGLKTVSTTSAVEGFILYACASGSTADDGDGAHSPFTTALLNHIADQNVNFNQVIKSVIGDVKNSTNNKQTPSYEDSTSTDIFLNGNPNVTEQTTDNIRKNDSNPVKISITLFIIFFIIMIVCFVIFTAKGRQVFVLVKDKSVDFKNDTVEFTKRTITTLKDKVQAAKEAKAEKDAIAQKEKAEKAKAEEAKAAEAQKLETAGYLKSVLIENSFYCSLSPVSVLQYKELTGKPVAGAEDADAEPVTNISYLEAAQFMNLLSSKDKLDAVYDLSDPQNIKIDRTKNGWRLPDESEWKKAAKNKELEDMLGLVWQWCNDEQKNKYVLKGGSWDSPKSLINTNSRMMVVKEFKSDAVGMIGVRAK